MSSNIRIASLNLFNFAMPPLAFHEFNNIYTQGQWQQKCDWTVRWLQQAQPDLVGWQEVFSPEPLRELCQAAGLAHFALVDSPVIEGFVARKSVVALASRFPIVSLAAVELDTELAFSLGLKEEFQSSRQILRATLMLPGIGHCDTYVVHFKSPRNKLPKGAVELQGAAGLLAESALGRWSATLQRGSEAMLLYQAILKQRRQSGNAVVLMGDFNAGIDSSELKGLLVGAGQLYNGDIRAAGLHGLPDERLKLQLAHFQLFDAWQLWREASEQSGEQVTVIRPVTHFHGSQGSVVDYLLLSQEFDARSQHSLAEVADYRVYDRHLLRPQFELDAQASDHTPILAEVRLRHP
ncbi:endonuclease/exonuclease/phosphatase family protein [Shewanella chilikensis]|uniref:endonuclease/exonuclease/phosphatase family protein n=1 Tax=Shewanella chilikensis TaxID=558541 RepID=UPI0030D1D912